MLACSYWHGERQLLCLTQGWMEGQGSFPDEELVDEASSYEPLTQLLMLCPLKSPPSFAPWILPSLWGLCKALVLVPFLPTDLQLIMPVESHAQTQLLLNKWQISFSAALPFPLRSTSLLSLQLKFHTTQQFLVPPTCLQSVYSHDMQHDHPLFHPASTSFFTQFFFFSLHFWTSCLILSAWPQ